MENPIDEIRLRSLVTEIIDNDPPIDALALTGGEPLLQSPFIRSFLSKWQVSVPVLLETAGTLADRLAEVIDTIDIVSMDLKSPSNTGEAPFWEEHRRFLEIARHRKVYCKLLVDENTSDAEVAEAARVVVASDPDIETFLQPITGEDGRTTISSERLDSFYRCLRQGLRSVRVLPQTHKMMGVR